MKSRLRKALSTIAYTNSDGMRSLPLFERSLLPLLGVASALYKLALHMRSTLYRYKILSAASLSVPVISVGNITWGGNGKTPMAEYLAHIFSHEGICPLILSRGYGGGDEVRLLKSHLSGSASAIVGVGPNRAEVANTLLQKFGVMDFMDFATAVERIGLHKDLDISPSPVLNSDMHSSLHHKFGIGLAILDDGMQHWSIARDYEIIMINAISPFGNGRLVPSGPLREPLKALIRADVVVIHHANLVSEKRLTALESLLEKMIKPETLIVRSQLVVRSLTKLSCSDVNTVNISAKGSRKLLKSVVPLEILKGASVLCLTGIGCPESFSLTLEQLGAVNVERMDFPDHHSFESKDMDRLYKVLQRYQEQSKKAPLVLLTEKDFWRDPDFFLGLHGLEVFVLNSSMGIVHQNGDLYRFHELISRKLQCWRG